MKDQEIIDRIQELRARRKAIILAHNYQPAVIQDIADLTGDSLELSRRAAGTDAEVIVFCGVHFMAETAAILNPQKTVLLPNIEAGCRMADMITVQDMLEIKRCYPGVRIVQYVNSSAAVKAESTICCTSANVVKVVESFKDEGLLYLAPDQNLAKYAASKTNRRIEYWHGYCPVHHSLTAAEVLARKREHPEAFFLAHPECTPEVLALADQVSSTSGMIRFVKESPIESFIIGTEIGILHPLRKQSPNKAFYPASRKMACPNMKKITLKHVLLSLELLQPRVTVDEEIRLRALDTVQRMLAIG
jgi:quinolinate synthase